MVELERASTFTSPVACPDAKLKVIVLHGAARTAG